MTQPKGTRADDAAIHSRRSLFVEIYHVPQQSLGAFRELAKLPPRAAKDVAAFLADNIERLTDPTEAHELSVKNPVKGVEAHVVFALIDALAPYIFEVLPKAADADELTQGLVVSIQRVARATNLGPLSDVAERKLRANLLQIFDNGVIRLKAKSLRLLSAHERVYQGGEVFSDIRPVLKVDGGMGVEAAVIYHTLRIRHSSTDRVFSVALDSKDLRELKSIIDRAIDKEACLSDLLVRAQVEQVKVS